MATRAPQIHKLNSRHVDEVDWAFSKDPTGAIKLLSFDDGVAFFQTVLGPGEQTTINSEPFRQILYVVEGELTANSRNHRSGTMIDVPEDVKYQLSTQAGSKWYVLQFEGSSKIKPQNPGSSA